MTAEAFPLSWPVGWPRTPPGQRKGARFSAKGYAQGGAMRNLTIAEAMTRLQAQLDMLGGGLPVLSCNLERRLDGLPRSGQAEPPDCGVALYFTLRGRPLVLACDRWNRVADNIAALAAHIDALRGMDRWGVGSVEQAFAGYTALPAPAAKQDWRAVLHVREDCSLEHAELAYRTAARVSHPDHPGGSHDQMARLNAAIEAARKELS